MAKLIQALREKPQNNAQRYEAQLSKVFKIVD